MSLRAARSYLGPITALTGAALLFPAVWGILEASDPALGHPPAMGMVTSLEELNAEVREMNERVEDLSVAMDSLGATLSGEAGPRNEDHYNRVWCEDRGGLVEVRLPSGARADCITDIHAIEADWSENWAEAIGQSAHYAAQTGLTPGILFLIHEGSQPAHLYRLEETIAHLGAPIEVFVVEAPRGR